MAFRLRPRQNVRIVDIAVQPFRAVVGIQPAQPGKGQAGTDHFGIAEYRRTGPQCLQARGDGVVPEHQRVRDARIRRRVDEPPHHAPFWCGKLYVQIAFRLDGPEAFALDFLSTQVPTYFHALSLYPAAHAGHAVRLPGPFPLRAGMKF